LLSYRLAPESHPIKTDTTCKLVVCGLISSVRFPHLKPTKRLGVAAGFIAMGILPRLILRMYFDTITSPQKRNTAAAT
jgi:hypothetical protein